ncbi:MAG: histidine phosphatase family protein [Acidimicrobiales bacterium]
MAVYLVRHGKAGSRRDWSGPDRERPLTDGGQDQARALVTLLADQRLAAVVSSPYLRCVQTVEPLAAKVGVRVEESPALAEGADLEATLELVRRLAPDGAVLCTHGDVIPAVLDALATQDGADVGPEWRWAKGSVWELEGAHGRIVTARYVPPPAA